MAKSSQVYHCTNCDAQSQKWSGRCLECGAWGTVVEWDLKMPVSGKSINAAPAQTISLASISGNEAQRIPIGLSEVDQVLGGGIVPGSLILLGGEPGIGKSSLQLQIAILLANQGFTILYCSGEESAQQVKLRLDRFSQKPPHTLRFIGETDIDTLCATIAKEKCALAIIDSVQTMATRDVPSEAGSVAQVRACTVKCLATAKSHDITLILTGHVTKEGQVAGPKTLEHLVDTVLYLEGDASNQFRLLKTVKNRFGSTNEIGVFEMTGAGLSEIKNPSELFIANGPEHCSGSVTTAICEGSRAFLVQIQALTSKTFFGYPQRKSIGADANRLQLLVAVLSKRLGLNLGDQDIHVNVVGGLKVTEPAADLAIAASILSSYKNKPLEKGCVIFGEVGLTGEIRAVANVEKRLKEAEKLGFTSAVIPKGKKKINTLLRITEISNLRDLEL